MRLIYVMPPSFGPVSSFKPLLPVPISINWQIKLLNMLTQNFSKIYIKPHPEDPSNLPTFLSSKFNISLIDGRFEEVIQNDDLLIYDLKASTTFGFAIRNNNPIVLIDFLGLKLDKNSFRALTQRIGYIEGCFDSNNLPYVNANDLFNEIKNCTQLNGKEFSKILLG